MSAPVQAAVSALELFGVADRAQARSLLELFARSARWSPGVRVTFGRWLRGDVPLNPAQVDLVVARFPATSGTGHQSCLCPGEIPHPERGMQPGAAASAHVGDARPGVPSW